MNITSLIVEWWAEVRAIRWWLVMGAGGAVLLAFLLAVRAVRARRARSRLAAANTPAAEVKTSAGSGGFYTAAFMSLGLSVDTSWRFFETEIGIENVVERVAMFSLLEVLLISCGVALRAQVRNPNTDGSKGPYQAVAWALTGGSAFMALMVTDDVLVGIARVGFGPVAGLLALHLALGLDLRHTKPASASTGTAARIANELLQRGLSYLGLANDDRDAARRRADRHARRLAWMVIDGIPTDGGERKKFDRALRLSNVAHDEEARARLLAELAVIRHVDKLADLDQSSPWGSEVRTPEVAAEVRTPDPAPAAEVRTPDPADVAEVRTPDPGPSTPDPAEVRTLEVAEVRTSDRADLADVADPEPRTSDPADVPDSGPRTEQFPALVGRQVPDVDDEVFAALVEVGVPVYREMVAAGQRPNQKTFKTAVRRSAKVPNDYVPALWAVVRERATLAEV